MIMNPFFIAGASFIAIAFITIYNVGYTKSDIIFPTLALVLISIFLLFNSENG